MPVPWQVVTTFMFVFVLSIALMLSVSTYSKVETVGAVIVPDKGVVSVTPRRAGVVAAVHVREGQVVRAGQLVATLVAPTVLSSGTPLQEGLQSSLEAQLAVLQRQAGELQTVAAERRTRLASTIGGLAREMTAVQQQISLQRDLVARSREDLERMRTIASRGFISQRDLRTREEQWLTRRQQLQQLEAGLAAKQASLGEAQRDRALIDTETRVEALRIESSRSELIQRMMSVQSEGGGAILAPVAGAVSGLVARTGHPVAAETVLLAIVPELSTLRSEIYVPVNAIGMVEVGQEVRLAVDAFPYQRYGTISGEIVSVAEAPTAHPAPGGGSIPAYLVTATLQTSQVTAFGQSRPLRPGMSATARVITSRRSLLEWLFEPLFAIGRR